MTIDRDQTFTLGDLIDAMEVEECRVTGMHDPTHTTKRFCEIQQAQGFRQLMEFLGVDMEVLPRRLSPWTHKDIASETGERAEYSTAHTREKHIRLLAWEAGAPMALFQPAADTVTDEGKERFLAALSDEYQSWQVTTRRLHEIYPDLKFPTEWFWATERALIADGKIEKRDISSRLLQPIKDAEVTA